MLLTAERSGRKEEMMSVRFPVAPDVGVAHLFAQCWRRLFACFSIKEMVAVLLASKNELIKN